MKKWVFLLISLVLFGTIYWFSSKEANVSSQQSDNLIIKLGIMTAEEIKENPEKAKEIRFLIRKSAHFVIYLVLGVSVYLTFYHFRVKGACLIGWITTIILSGFDEFHQSFVPGRSMELRDVIIDSSGALLGILILMIIHVIKKKKDPYHNVYYFGR